MKIRLRSILAGPRGSRREGSVLDDDDIAVLGVDPKALVDGGYAEVVDEEAVETASIETETETASAAVKPSKKKG